MSPTARKLLFSLVPVALLLAGGELAARALWQPEAGLEDVDAGVQMVAHPTRIWGLQPDSTVRNFGVDVTVDGDGLRVGAGPEDAAHTWMVVGDSSFFGHGLAAPDTLHTHLASALAASGQPTRVLCGAVPGYSVLQTRRMLDDVGWARRPDLLVVGNLWSDNNFDRFTDVEWLADLDARTGRGVALLGRSRLVQWLSAALAPVRPVEQGDPLGRISWIRDPTATGQRRVPVERYHAELDALFGEAAARGVGVVVVQPANRYRVASKTGSEAVPYTWDPYFAAQREVAAHRGVPVVDAAAALRVFGLGGDAAFLDEMHPTGAANQAIALAVSTAALQAGWPGASLVPDMGAGPPPPAPTDHWIDSGRHRVNAGQDAPR